ncbi:hypothetical protein SLE2022_378630 [Rubroshorea leprosula]
MNMVTGQGNLVIVVKMVLLNTGMGKQTKKREGQVLPYVRKIGLLSLSSLRTPRGGIFIRGIEIGTGLRRSRESINTGKKKMATKSIAKENVTWIMRMTGIEDSLLQDLREDPVQKKSTVHYQGMLIMEKGDVCHQSDSRSCYTRLLSFSVMPIDLDADCCFPSEEGLEWQHFVLMIESTYVIACRKICLMGWLH